MERQLAEIMGEEIPEIASIEIDEHRQAMLEQHGSGESLLSLSLDQGRPMLLARFEEVELRYYFMDIELLFSQKPFQSAENSAPSAPITAPNLRQQISLNSNHKSMEIEIPEAAVVI